MPPVPICALRPVVMSVAVFELLLVLLCITVTFELFDDDAAPVTTLLPPVAEFDDEDVFAALAVPVAPPVAEVSAPVPPVLCPVLDAGPPLALLLADWLVLLA